MWVRGGFFTVACCWNHHLVSLKCCTTPSACHTPPFQF
ncbi:hypothetical protein GLYMA_08G173550v4 [Glycine max]|nr:hypothetical protein GLYMA_08G173550v4 [Glycine max]KAH1051712.1 hypothetical protein GYH30_021551 [Glycine max]